VGEEFHQLIEGSELHFINECGHAPMMEHPVTFNQLMDGFLAKLP
jgi:pimeloyl-ACP methyl ester carboxylesterase